MGRTGISGRCRSRKAFARTGEDLKRKTTSQKLIKGEEFKAVLLRDRIKELETKLVKPGEWYRRSCVKKSEVA